MKIVLAGSSGQLGTILAEHFYNQGHQVVGLARQPQTQPWSTLLWDGETLGGWQSALDGCDVLINLAGRSVNCRYTPRNQAEIMSSRVRSTRVLGEAAAVLAQPPKVWLQASTATIYAHSYDQPHDEQGTLGGQEPDAPAKWRFSIEVGKNWEAAARQAAPAATRLVLMRSALVLSPDRGGIFDTLLRLVRFGLGGPVAGGRQRVSWVHDADFIAMVDWLIANPDIHGAINLAAPSAPTYAEFMAALRQAWDIPLGLPATRWMLEIGAWLMRTESELVLKSRYIKPGILLQRDFKFQYPDWPGAARELCQRWRAQ